MLEFATADGTLHYEVLEPTAIALANPPTLTLLHNFMSTGRTAWGPLLDKLTEYHRVLLFDLPGHGRSQGYPAGFNHEAMARQVADLMDAEGFAHGHVAGCSSGGMIAQLLVHHELVLPTSLTLVSTTYSTNPQTTGQKANFTPENFRAGSGWMEATSRLHEPYHGAGYYEEALLASYRALDHTSTIDLTLDALRAWAFPVCLIHGAWDEFFAATIPQSMAAALPDAELHLIPRQTHALIFTKPRQVADLMVDFLERTL